MPWYFSQFSREEHCERATSTEIIVYGTVTEHGKQDRGGTSMADQEQLDRLRIQGARMWNRWRARNSDVQIDLSNTTFRDGILRSADLSNANLSNVHLIDAILEYTDLGFANLSNTTFNGVYLSNVILSGANLSNTIILSAFFGAVDLSTVKGLETVKHHAPSTIGIDTIIKSQGRIPENFLRNAGVPSSIIEQIPALIGSLKPIDYYSCFISYSSKDQAFAEQLYADLRIKDVSCWYDQEDMKIGDKIRPRIEETIRKYDKLLLVLSENSIASNWVAYEVERALNKEPQGIPNVLFPIRVDDAVMKSKAGWADDIKSTRHIGDFTRWKSHDDYQKAFTHLLRDLKAEG
jgi:hypothetical protein